MKINSNYYIHELDKSALQALKAIPGFTQLLKAFMKNWNEQLLNIVNMSTNLRISEKQLPKYHNMLPPICEKLGIEVPDLYIKLDREPNASTYGDTKPFIVLTSGLIETLPEELIPTVLAHECGHIACNHSLYTTMGNLLLSGASEVLNIFVGLGDIVLLPIRAAFWHWMRCSEYSADRAAVVYNGNASKMIEVCMRLSGLDKKIADDANVEAFMEQAAQYKELVDGNRVNKAMELYMFLNSTHPLNAVRAYEINEWQQTDSFCNTKMYMESKDPTSCENLPLSSISEYMGKDFLYVGEELSKAGFTNVELIRKTTATSKKNIPSQVIEIAINGKTKFEDADWYPRDSAIEIAYYLPESEEEIAAAHPGQRQIHNSSRGFNGKNFNEIVEELKELGFTNITTYEQEGPIMSLLMKEHSIARITINGNSQFETGTWFHTDATIRITYNIFPK